MSCRKIWQSGEYSFQTEVCSRASGNIISLLFALILAAEHTPSVKFIAVCGSPDDVRNRIIMTTKIFRKAQLYKPFQLCLVIDKPVGFVSN